ncbi:MAG: hypothetical protein KKB62_00940 [Nanoarchaeota archaeon]|nr:hypothetical protein [Nanoarchaeota archaeon]
MGVIVKVPPEELTKEQLVNIYNLYREAYGVKYNYRDEIYLRGEGIELINNHEHLGYRPFMGAKFFAQPMKDKIDFWGYTIDYDQDEEASKFEKLVKNYFKDKI